MFHQVPPELLYVSEQIRIYALFYDNIVKFLKTISVNVIAICRRCNYEITPT